MLNGKWGVVLGADPTDPDRCRVRFETGTPKPQLKSVKWVNLAEDTFDANGSSKRFPGLGLGFWNSGAVSVQQRERGVQAYAILNPGWDREMCDTMAMGSFQEKGVVKMMENVESILGRR